MDLLARSKQAKHANVLKQISHVQDFVHVLDIAAEIKFNYSTINFKGKSVNFTLIPYPVPKHYK